MGIAIASLSLTPWSDQNACALHGWHGLQDAAHWLMDQPDVHQSEASWQACQAQKMQEAAESVRREKASRKELLDKYHLQAVNSSASIPTCRNQQTTKSKVWSWLRMQTFTTFSLTPDWQDILEMFVARQREFLSDASA